MIYAFPQLSRRDFGVCRFFGDGLGNVLIPWARALVAARRDGLVEVAPTWRQVFQHSGPREWLRDVGRGRAGTFWNGARDYGRLFRAVPGEITGARRLRVLLAARRSGQVMTEVAYRRRRARGEAVAAGTVVIFRGMRGRFWDLAGEHGFLREQIRRRCQPEPGVRQALTFDSRRAITVHIRLGDFVERGSLTEIRHHQINGRLPMAWYLEKVQQLRDALDDRPAWPIHVFSDGSDAQLAPLLALPGCRRVSFGSALADLLAMANANVMLCSLSTLNAWSAFLGRVPAVHLRGVLHTPVLRGDRPAAEIESDVGEALPATFLAEVRRRSDEPPPLAPLGDG